MRELSTRRIDEMESFIVEHRSDISAAKIGLAWSGWHDEDDLILSLKSASGRELAELRNRVLDWHKEKAADEKYRAMLEKYGIPVET